MTDEDDDVECCMTTGEINAKYVALRGSLLYKYPPKEARCRKECGYLHYVIESPRGRRVVEHPCFLAIGHEGWCQFSSECRLIAETMNA